MLPETVGETLAGTLRVLLSVPDGDGDVDALSESRLEREDVGVPRFVNDA